MTPVATDEFIEALRERGLRITQPRRAVCGALDQAGSSDDVRIVYDRASNKRQLSDPMASGTWTYVCSWYR